MRRETRGWGDQQPGSKGSLLQGRQSRRGLLMLRAAAIAAAAVMGAMPSALAQAAKAWESEGEPVRHVTVTVMKSRTFRIDRPFKTAVVGSPDIADVLPMTDRSIYIQGKKVGTTNISVFDDNMRIIGVLDVEVAPDTGNLQDKILGSTGNRGIRVTSTGGEVVLTGEASDAVSAERAVAVAKGLSPDAPVINAMKVAPSQQVMLKVRFLEATRDGGRQLGVNWFASSGGTRVNTGIGGLINGLATNATPGTIPLVQTAGSLAGTTSAPFGVLIANLVNGGTNIDLLVTALESKGLVRRLAEPDLIALSGDTASFLAGGEFPVPVVQTSSGTVPTISIQYTPFGVQLTFLPTVLAGGIINLRLAPSVSELDFADAVQVSGFTIPALTKREARTTVELREGQSFAIAGLLQADNTGNIAQLPWIGSVPVLGALFRSTSYQQHETDLVIIVTPHLVKPAAPGQPLATPFDQRLPANDVDAFVFGKFEMRKEYVDYVTTGGSVQGPYGHIIQAEAGSNEPAERK